MMSDDYMDAHMLEAEDGPVKSRLNETPSPVKKSKPSMNSVEQSFIQAIDDPNHPYHDLAEVLMNAYHQAAFGKGKERHANDLPFHKQPMQVASQLLDSADGLRFQVIKKVKESKQLPFEAQQKELLGAIVYTAGVLVFNRDKEIQHGG